MYQPLWLARTFERDDAVRDIQTTLGSDLQVPLYDVTQVRILVKVAPSLVRERLQSRQAIAEFVQAPPVDRGIGQDGEIV